MLQAGHLYCDKRSLNSTMLSEKLTAEHQNVGNEIHQTMNDPLGITVSRFAGFQAGYEHSDSRFEISNRFDYSIILESIRFPPKSDSK